MAKFKYYAEFYIKRVDYKDGVPDHTSYETAMPLSRGRVFLGNFESLQPSQHTMRWMHARAMYEGGRRRLDAYRIYRDGFCMTAACIPITSEGNNGTVVPDNRAT